MQNVRETFEGLSWLANAIGIIVFIGGALAVIHRILERRRMSQDLGEFYTASLDSWWTPSYAKEFIVTTIVDDKPGDFPLAELRAAGYIIESVKSVSLGELDHLAIKDVIFLDIKGIVKDDPERGGLHVIDKLRERNSFQKICAVSSQTFDPTATAFFRKADDQKIKPLTAFECQETIDHFISQMFQVEKLFAEANLLVRSLSVADRAKVRDLIDRYTRERKSDTEFLGGLRAVMPAQGNQHVLYSLARIIKCENRRLRAS